MMGYVEAFKSYDAKLKNPQWSVSAVNNKGELVLSLWEHHFKKTSERGYHLQKSCRLMDWRWK